MSPEEEHKDMTREEAEALMKKEPGKWCIRPLPIERAFPKVGRNKKCPCGSDRKFKHCCGKS